MSDFNYQEYLRNNPLLKEEVKDQLITEGLNEDKYDDIVAADDDIPADQKKAAAAAYRKVDKGASAEKALKNVKEEEVTEYVDKLGDDNALKDALKVLKDKAKKAGKKVADFVKDIEVGSMQQAMTEEEVTEETSSKMTVSELKAKIKEDILSILSEQDEEEDVEVDVEDEVELEADPEDLPDLDAADAQEGLSADEKEIQDSLKIAYDNAVAIGDTKLADQIGNSITFFTRTHVVER